eukprot:Seg1553.7 transcript_id=Seg1553.7/GoldUCD/mRNA.D3Y31 product="hypothetical protein" protein_id=Seg1553.7/GoldUCD/D3Y31
MADAEQLKRGKIDRRTAKAAFTRALKAVQHVIANERPAEEVQEVLGKLQGAFENLLNKHEEFTKLIEDDEDYEREESWLAECQDSFMETKTKAKQFIDKSKENTSNEDKDEESEKSSVISGNSREETLSENPEQSDGLPSMQSMTQGDSNDEADDKEEFNDERDHYQAFQGLMQKGNSMKEQQFCGFKVEKPKMPSVSGDVREYAIFRSDFKHAIEARYTKRDAITLLRTCLKDKPLELIKGIGSDYDAAWEYLDAIYGDPRFVSDAITQYITKFRPLQHGEDARFCDLVHLVKRCFDTLKEVGIPSDMDNSHMLSIIEQKMCADDRKIWARYLEQEKKVPTLQALI